MQKFEVYSSFLTVPVELDPDLPAEVVKQMQNNECKICHVKVSVRNFQEVRKMIDAVMIERND